MRNHTTFGLARTNLAIRGIFADIRWSSEGTLLRDEFPDERFNYILANSPFNLSDWSGELLRENRRWRFGVPPVGNASELTAALGKEIEVEAALMPLLELARIQRFTGTGSGARGWVRDASMYRPLAAEPLAGAVAGDAVADTIEAPEFLMSTWIISPGSRTRSGAPARPVRGPSAAKDPPA